MKFDAKKAEHDYVTDSSMSYRRLAEKYEVNPSTVTKYAKRGDWVKKRKKYQTFVTQKSIEKAVEKESDKMAALSSATDRAIEIVVQVIDTLNTEDNGFSIKNFKDTVAIMKDLAGLQRNLNGLLTEQEKQNLELAREKLTIERIRAGLHEEEDGESGIVLIPSVVSESDADAVQEG